MKIISPYVELIQQEPGIDGIYRHIEKCGRTCYKSEDKITQDSADAFFNNLLKNRHYAILEHGTVYLTIPMESEPNELGQTTLKTIKGNYTTNPYSMVNYYDYKQMPVGTQKDFCEVIPRSIMYVTTNMRVIVENGWADDLQYICEPTEFHVPRITLKFITNIGVTREGNRMRANSIAEESTRYCNYSNEKFGNEITFTAPSWLSKEQIGSHNSVKIFEQASEVLESCNYIKEELAEIIYLRSCAAAELNYLFLIKLGWTPQQAREVLPLATKSEVVYTAFPYQWKHFFDLRLFGTTGKPHPNMQEIAELAKSVLEENNLWNLIYPADDKNC